MTRRGYLAEYGAKKKLEKRYGSENVIKIAIGGSADFLILSPKKNKIEKIVEVKSTAKKKYYPREHEKKQINLLKKLAKDHHIPLEIWIKFKDQKEFKIVSDNIDQVL